MDAVRIPHPEPAREEAETGKKHAPLNQSLSPDNVETPFPTLTARTDPAGQELEGPRTYTVPVHNTFEGLVTGSPAAQGTTENIAEDSSTTTVIAKSLFVESLRFGSQGGFVLPTALREYFEA